MKLYTSIGWAALLACSVLPISRQARGAFPAAGTDTTTSLGQFSIVVNPSFSSLAPGITGGFTYNPTTNILTSP